MVWYFPDPIGQPRLSAHEQAEKTKQVVKELKKLMSKPNDRLYDTAQWIKALGKVGVPKDTVLKAAVILLNEDIKKMQHELKTFKRKR